MRRIVLSVALSGALLASLVGGASAASPKHAEPGTPGTPNCVGQTTAWIAQLGAEVDIHGFAGVANALELSVQELKAIIEEYCAGGE